MRIFLSLVLLVALVVGFGPQARAELEIYTLENPHTQIVFAVSHLGFSHSYGKFLEYEGRIEFDRDAPEKSKVEVTIQTASIAMGTEKWDDHMKNEDFFNVEQYPTMTFKSTAIEMTGENTANIVGDLTILETTKPVVLATTFNKAGPHPFGSKYMAGFSAVTKINRSDFGMDYGLPNVGDEVRIFIEVEAEREGALTHNE